MRYLTAALYLTGLVVFGAGVYTLVGTPGALMYGGVVLAALGGLKALGRILWGGLGRYPPRDWDWSD